MSNNRMEVKFVRSIRDKTLLVLENYKFSVQKEIKSSSETRWKCINRKCKGNIYTLGLHNDADIVITKSDLSHNHEANVSALNRQIIGSTCKRKAVEDLAERPSKILKHVLSENLPESLSTVDMGYLRKNMYNARRQIIPVLPKNISDTHSALNQIDVRTTKGELFVFLNDSIHNIIVFSCKTNIELIPKTNRIYVDGTFNYCAIFFCQLFTIHVFINDHYVPIFFCLLPNKESATYKKLFILIKEECEKHNIIFYVDEVVVDFEKAIHKAILDFWPEVKIIGCRFHLCQSWYRKIQKCGLGTEYKNKTSEIGKWLRLIFGLTYLDPNEIGNCFALELFENMPNDSRVIKFSDYLVDNYIAEEAKFPPKIWAENSANISRTTNACESFHNHFNNSFYSAHPNLFVLIEKLKEIQIDVYIKIQSLHITNKIHNRSVKNKQKFVNEMILKRNRKEINNLHFLRCISLHQYDVNYD